MDALAVGAFGVSMVAAGLSWLTHTKSVAVSNFDHASELTLEIDRLFIANPQLRPLFYENVPVRDHADRNLALAAAEFVTDAFECIWDMAKSYDEDDRTAWSDYFRHVFTHSPVLREHLDSCPALWYPGLTSWLTDYQRVSSAAALVD